MVRCCNPHHQEVIRAILWELYPGTVNELIASRKVAASGHIEGIVDHLRLLLPDNLKLRVDTYGRSEIVLELKIVLEHASCRATGFGFPQHPQHPGPSDKTHPLPSNSALEKHIISRFISSSLPTSSDVSGAGGGRQYEDVYANLARCLTRHLVSTPPPYLATQASINPMLNKLRLQASIPHLQSPWEGVMEVCARWPKVFKLDITKEVRTDVCTVGGVVDAISATSRF